MKPVIHSRKHYVQWTITPVSVGTTVTENIVEALELQSVTDSDHVEEGASVRAIYIELWLIGQSDSASGNFLLNVYKLPGGSTQMNHAEAIALHDYDNKKNIFYHTQGISNDGVANAQAVLRGWVKIPKGKQRMGLKDRIVLTVSTQAEAVNYCGFATYKEYT